MPHQLKLINELPDWFDIKQYTQCASFSELDWIIQLYLRQQQYYYQQPCLITGIVKDWVPCIQKKPATDLVRHLTVGEVRKLASCLDHFYAQQPIPDDTELNQCVYSPLADGMLRIDLTATHEVILKNVSQWLNEKRDNEPYPSRSRYTPAMLGRWSSSQALACWDLQTWALSNEIGIPNWIMGDAIFEGSNQGNRAERVRQTTRKCVEELKSRHCLAGLLSQYSTTHTTIPALPELLVLSEIQSAHILNETKK